MLYTVIIHISKDTDGSDDANLASLAAFKRCHNGRCVRYICKKKKRIYCLFDAYMNFIQMLISKTRLIIYQTFICTQSGCTLSIFSSRGT